MSDQEARWAMGRMMFALAMLAVFSSGVLEEAASPPLAAFAHHDREISRFDEAETALSVYQEDDIGETIEIHSPEYFLEELGLPTS